MKLAAIYLCCGTAAVAMAVRAADYAWMSSPADAYWNSTSLNWNSGEAWVDGNNAIFGASSSKTVTLDGNRTAADISVNGYTFKGSSTLSWTGTMTVSGTTYLQAPLADSGNGLRFAPGAYVFLYGSNLHTGGTYVGGADDKAFALSAGDVALGAVPAAPQTNVVVLANKYATFYVTASTDLNANRHFLIEDGAWLGFAGQSRPTLRIKGEIHGEILPGQSYPTTTHLKSHHRSDWLSHVVLDPGEGHTNSVGTLSLLGWLEIASGVTSITAPAMATGSGGAIGYVGGGNEYQDYRGRLTISSGAELYAPPEQGFRRFHADNYANVEVVGGKVNMPKTEYLNALSTYPARLTISDGGELICREFRLSQARSGDGGEVCLNNGGRLTVSTFRMDSDYPAVINFNGGIVSRLNNDFIETDFTGMRQSSNYYGNVRCKVLAGGAIIEPRNGYNIFWRLPFKSGVAAGDADGGLTVRGENIFVLTVSGSDYNGPTRLEPGARMQCRAANALPSGTTLQLGADTTIGFNVWDTYEDVAQTVARVEGCGKVFRNSRFVVTEAIAPVFDGAYGTLTLEKACSLNCDYEITGDAEGCSRLYLEAGYSTHPEKQDISGMTLKVADLSAFDRNARKGKYKILEAPYGYEGRFNLGNVDEEWTVSYTATAAYLHFRHGSVLTIR
ncbi:MAG: hypothetical protein IKE55_00855 [Kiritimatiellae bacterium]|nr:hypothetical protein [Kiritimatiellia bacterium]